MRELPVERFNDNHQDEWRSWLSLRSPIVYISYISDQICLITLIWLGNYLACSAGHEFWDTCRWLENHPVWYEIHPQIVVFPLSRLFSGVYDQWLYHRIFHHWAIGANFHHPKRHHKAFVTFLHHRPSIYRKSPKKSATSQPASFFFHPSEGPTFPNSKPLVPFTSPPGWWFDLPHDLWRTRNSAKWWRFFFAGFYSPHQLGVFGGGVLGGVKRLPMFPSFSPNPNSKAYECSMFEGFTPTAFEQRRSISHRTSH